MTNARNDRSQDRGTPKYTVSDVTKLTGVSKAKLIDYDAKGILCPAKVVKGESQEWRMYSEEDLDRLEKIVVLLAYDFRLREIKTILDDPDTDLADIVERKLEELRQVEWRLRNLLLFAKFVNIADTELYEGLIRGPSDIDDFADMIRGSEEYALAMERISQLSEDALADIFEELDEIVRDYVSTDPEQGFAGVEREIERFSSWWERHVSVSPLSGYLQFWAIFEDDSVIASEVEEVGGEVAAASLQMSAFYACMKSLILESQGLIEETAQLSDTDVVASLGKLRELSLLIGKRMGVEFDSKLQGGDEAELTSSVLSYMAGIIGDDELKDYIDPKGLIDISSKDIEQAQRLFDAIRDAD